MVGQQVVTPPATVGLVGPALGQYQYGFPNVIKVAASQNTNNLSVVSGPAPVVQRPEVSSAGLPHPILTSHPTSAHTPQPNWKIYRVFGQQNLKGFVVPPTISE